MIRFECEHCRRPVRVDDACGGKQGRCPHCKEVVSIPGTVGPIGALAAALKDDTPAGEDDTALGTVPPPPPVDERPLEEDLLLPDGHEEELADTVILPAEGFLSSPAQPYGRHLYALERRPPPLSTKRTFLVVAVVIVVLAAAAIGFFLITQMD